MIPALKTYDGHPTESVTAQLLPSQPAVRSERGRVYRPAQIFGTPDDPGCLAGIGDYEIAVSTPSLSANRTARVVGFCGIITEDKRLLSPYEINLSNVDEFIRHNEFNHQGFLFQKTPDGLRVDFKSSVPTRFWPGRALFLHNIEPGNYGSFIFRQLPQMLMAANQTIEADYYIVADRTPWLNEAIALAGLPSRPILTVREVCGNVFDQIIMIAGIDNGGFLASATRSDLTRLGERAKIERGGLAQSDKIYVSRRLSANDRPWYRVMRNEGEVEEKLRQRGFAIVYPEAHSLVEQIRLFSAARSVIGPSGSGMFNSIFADGDCKITDIETFHVTVAQHALFYASSKRQYSFLFTSPDEASTTPKINRSYVLDHKMLESAVSWCMDYA